MSILSKLRWVIEDKRFYYAPEFRGIATEEIFLPKTFDKSMNRDLLDVIRLAEKRKLNIAMPNIILYVEKVKMAIRFVEKLLSIAKRSAPEREKEIREAYDKLILLFKDLQYFRKTAGTKYLIEAMKMVE